MEKPAIEGGAPTRDTLLSYGRQYIDEDDIRAVTEVMRGDMLTCGPMAGRAEREISRLTGARYTTVVSSGTAALHCACMAAGIAPGDEVIVPPVTFAASANCVLYCGGTPVFADIDPYTWEIDPEEILKKISPRTKAVLTVDYTGQPCDYQAITEICRERNLLLIEDAAHAIGTRYRGQNVGEIADITTFSFHPVKTVTSGEGGAAVTNSEAYRRALHSAARHGITHDSALTGSGEGWYYEQLELGNNYRITDMQCALLLSQLKKLPEFIERRRCLTENYRLAFRDMPEITLQQEYPGSETARHLFVIRFNLEKLRCGRRRIYDALRAENIGVNVHYIPVYYFPYYAKMGYRRGICPQAEALYNEIITLPLHCSMTDGDQRDVIAAVKKVVSYYKR